MPNSVSLGLPKNFPNRRVIGWLTGAEKESMSIPPIPRSSLISIYSILLLYERTLENQNGLSFFSPKRVASPSSIFTDSYSSKSNLFQRPNGRDRSVRVI